MSKRTPTVDTSAIYNPSWSRISGDDRAQSIAVSHVTLLALAITLIGGIAAAGAGPISDAQAEVMVDIAEDRFDEWDDDVANALQTGGLQQESMTVPTGTYAGGDVTTITITDDDPDIEDVEIETTHFVYTPRGSDQSIRYDAGLITHQPSQTNHPSIRSEPSSTHVNSSSTNTYTLNLVEYNLTESVVAQSAYSRDIRFNVSAEPEEDKTYTTQNAEGDSTSIIVEGPNYQSWERYFEDNANTDSDRDIFSSVATDDDNQRVEAEISVEQFRLESNYVRLAHSRR